MAERDEQDRYDATDKPSDGDHSQREYFGDGRSNPAATRPPVGAPADPALPGEPTAGNEELYERPEMRPGDSPNEPGRGEGGR